MVKDKYNTREWESVSAEVLCNTEDKLQIAIYGYVGIKKNGRINMRGMSLPSRNYVEWHKRMIKCLGKEQRKYNSFPCHLDMKVLYGTKRRTDLDNRLSSIMDTFQDLGILEDDSHDIIQEVSMTSLGYAKNSPIMIITLTKSISNRINDETDYKGKDIKCNLDYFADTNG